VSALSGLNVKLLVPGKSDSRFVNAASKSYYERLLQAGVQIYMYQKGFVHAKTIVTDQKLCVVGTSNMDNRSFDLNFEVNAIVYDNIVAEEMRQIFYNDLQHATQINKEEWFSRPWHEKFPGKIARLFSPVM
jgi:cardiolipin synthase